jgi:hypothetical protein
MRILSQSARTSIAALSLVSAVACFFGANLAALAQEDADLAIVRVEEDWELVVKSPDENSAGPQVACAISPYADVDYANATFELNHQSLPQFVAGGIQLQTWADENPIDSRKFPKCDVLQHDGEIVKWTQTMRINDGVVTFEIINGTSQTWGTFGGQGYLKSSMTTNLNNLSSYRPSVSVNNSGVSYGANLVTSLTLKKVRVQWSDGTWSESSSDISVYSDQ